MTKQKTKTKNQARKKSKKKINLRIINNFILLILVFSIVAYIGTVNDIPIKAFVLQDKKVTSSKLKNQQDEFELKVMRLSSLNNLNQRVEKLKMVKAEKIEYISASAVAVAK